jgi:hypothetical protein
MTTCNAEQLVLQLSSFTQSTRYQLPPHKCQNKHFQEHAKKVLMPSKSTAQKSRGHLQADHEPLKWQRQQYYQPNHDHREHEDPFPVASILPVPFHNSHCQLPHTSTLSLRIA